MDFQKEFDKTAVLDFLINKFLPERFEKNRESIAPSRIFPASDHRIDEIEYIGESSELDLKLYVVRHRSEGDPRVTLSRETFRIMSKLGVQRALVVFHSANSSNYRLSLATITLAMKGTKTEREYSNPRRYSFFLGPEAKTHTPEQFLSERVKNYDDLLNRFSIEVVNKDFYETIAIKFTELVGGKRKIKSRVADFTNPALHLPSIDISRPENHIKAQEFAVRLIGRIVFCWFLKKKKSPIGDSLLPDSMLSKDAVLACKKTGDSYYHAVLENLFFQALNSEMSERSAEFQESPYNKIPFLNGGLFEPHDDDKYEIISGVPQVNFGLKISNNWFLGLFQILETYNFTIDENTSVDIELAVDPEMLGRIFENLLAEINPETGETARKSTGSYYTPRPIVEHMVVESLKAYLITKTAISKEKLADLLSYSESEKMLSEAEKEKVIAALDEVKIIDPACGSGAFPMGMLQKIVLVLEKVDPDSRKWLTRILQGMPDATAREMLQKKLEGESDLCNYTRKLGVIQKSIYGVDIQPIAVEISKLRFFLSLVVDEKVDDRIKNRGIIPLPNLEFKFVCANSLMGLPKSEHVQENDTDMEGMKAEQERLGKEYIEKLNAGDLNLFERNQFQDRLSVLAKEIKKNKKNRPPPTSGYFELNDKISELKVLRERYFTSSGLVKKKIAKQFGDIQRVMFSNFLHAESQTMKLSTWEPFRNNQSEWFDAYWMFGIKDGFDILIANPPYLGEKGHKEVFRALKRGTLGNFYQGKMDLFYFFYHLALNILKDKSPIAFITTSYWLTATGAEKLRKDLKSRAVFLKLVNFNELKIFESALGQHNLISILSKDTDAGIYSSNCCSNRTGVASPEILQRILEGEDTETNYWAVRQSDLFDGDGAYIRPAGISLDGDDALVQKILHKISHQGVLLGNICNINSGADITISKITNKHLQHFKGDFTQNDGVFVVDQNELSSIGPSKAEQEILKNFIKNSNIEKYHVSSADEKLIYLRWEDTIEKYPNIKRHLLRFKAILEDQQKRYGESYPWYALHRPREQAIFDSKDKILVPYRSYSNIFAYSEIPIYASRDVFFITRKETSIDLKYILPLLNSKLYYVWLYNRGKRKGETLELYQQPLSEIPIKTVGAKEQKPFIDISTRMIRAKASKSENDFAELEAEANQLVYNLYGLTAEEKRFIEALK